MTYSKFYPGTNASKDNSEKLKTVTSVWKAIKDVEESNPEPGLDPATYNFNGQVIDGGLGGTIAARPAKATTKADIIIEWAIDYYYRLARDITINNGFMVWSTKDILPLLDESEFYINFDITYVATGPNGEAVESQGNYFQILYNFYNEDVIGQSAGNQNPWSTSFSQFLYWQDLSEPYNMRNDIISGSPYDDSKHPINADGKLHKERIQLKISTSTGGFWGNVFEILGNWLTGKDQTQIYNIRYPVFALGYGKPGMKYYADLYTQKDGGFWGEDTVNHTRFMDWKNTGDSSDSRYYNGKNEDIQRYIFESNSNYADGFQTYNPSQVSNPNGYENKRNSDITETGSILEGFKRYSSAYDNRERAYFNSYFEVDGGVKLYIKDFTATFTNREGNTASLINNVDYVNGGYVYENNLWSSWPATTGTQVQINWGSNNGVAELEFYRTGNYVVATDGSGRTDNGSDILSNADGYAPAAINPNL